MRMATMIAGGLHRMRTELLLLCDDTHCSLHGEQWRCRLAQRSASLDMTADSDRELTRHPKTHCRHLKRPVRQRLGLDSRIKKQMATTRCYYRKWLSRHRTLRVLEREFNMPLYEVVFHGGGFRAARHRECGTIEQWSLRNRSQG